MYVYLRAKFEVSEIILMSNFNPKAYDNKEFSHEN